MALSSTPLFQQIDQIINPMHVKKLPPSTYLECFSVERSTNIHVKHLNKIALAVWAPLWCYQRVVEITLEVLQMVLLAVGTVDSDLLECLPVPWQVGGSSPLLFWLRLVYIYGAKISQIVWPSSLWKPVLWPLLMLNNNNNIIINKNINSHCKSCILEWC